MHTEMQWANIAGSELHEPSPDPELWDRGPKVGYLPRPYAQRLAELLKPLASQATCLHRAAFLCRGNRPQGPGVPV